MNNILQSYKNETENELGRILDFWMKYASDKECGGFYGRMNNDNFIFNHAPKGSVLNSRILWTFSAAFNLRKNKKYLEVSERAFEYIRDYFLDKEYGGIYWTVDYKGNPLDTKKQIYALAFAIYGLSEFYISSENGQAKDLAIELYHAVVKYSYDEKNGGYIEALSRDWQALDDLRLSRKDANEKKSMNTHLHVLEAFANLYRIWTDENLKGRIVELISVFSDHIIDPETYHLILFFDDEWNKKSDIISYGHDIEAAWLLQEAAELIDDKELIEKMKKQAVLMANAVTEGIDKDGGLWYEYDVERHSLIREKHSWPQAEAMIGFFNAWQITGNKNFLECSVASWHFIKEHIIDKRNGEWFWGVKEDNSVMDEDKIGIWKCPYHNSRACMEIMKRSGAVENLSSSFAKEAV